MAHLTISLLGPLQVSRDEQSVGGFAYNKARALLAYLVVETDRSHQRDTIVGLLWPEMPDAAARTNLRQVLTSLRDTIGSGDPAAPFLLTTRDTLQFNPASDYTLDVTRFVALLDACARHRHRHVSRCPACAARLEEATTLYRGDFLAQLSSIDSAPFEEWLVVKREALHQRAVTALAHLAHYHERWGDVPRARQLLSRLIELEPWDEAAYAHLMRLSARAGQRSAALTQYETCRRILAEQFGVEPAATTKKLYEQIRDELEPAVVPPTRPLNLPIAASRLIGREAELIELTELLADPTRHLITIVGPGGIGKTRLAAAAAMANAPVFEDGAVFVNLASLSSAELLAATMLGALGQPIDQAVSPEQQLIGYLRGRERLLVLDNFEHLLAGVDLIVRILQQATEVTLLITSRERLALQAEQVFELDGLSCPAKDGDFEPESVKNRPIEQSGAVQLFIERAQQVQRKFQWRPEADAIARICRLVEGLPLAIELAASTVGVQTCATIADNIATSLRRLVTKYRDLPERHRSMWAVFEHSWNLLNDDEQQVFSRFAIFRGGFRLEAAEQVTSATQEILAALIDKSLLRRDGGLRFELHELLRQYAAEKLKEAGQVEAAQKDHLVCFLELAESAEPQLYAAKQSMWLERLDREHDNLRAALNWAILSRQTELAGRLAGALTRFWMLRSYLSEGRQWADTVLALPGAMSIAAREKLLGGAGALAYRQSDLLAAKNLIAGSLALARELADPDEITRRLQGLAVVATHQGDYTQASELIRECLEIDRAHENLEGIAFDLDALGDIAYRQSDYLQARRQWEDSLALHRQRQDKNSIAICLNNLGEVALHLGDYRAAIAPIEEAIALSRDLGNQQLLALVLVNLSQIRAKMGEYTTASALYREVLQIQVPLNAQADIALTLEMMAELALSTGDPARSVRLYAAGAALRETSGVPLTPTQSTDMQPQLATARTQLGEVAFQAAWQAGRALSLAQAISYALEETDHH